MSNILSEYSKAIKSQQKKNKYYPPYHEIKVSDSIAAYGLQAEIFKLTNQFLPLKSFAFWIHGWVWGPISSPSDLLGYNLDKNINILVRNQKEKEVFLNNGYKKVFAVGLPLLYSNKKIIEHVDRKEGSLLVFPPHSTNEGRADLDKSFISYLDYIKDHESEFSEIGISLYGLDFIPEVVDRVKKYNFKIIPGVNWNDKNALQRLQFNLNSYEYSTTNNIGSHVLYSLYAGQKFSFSGDFLKLNEKAFIKQIQYEENFLWPQSAIDNTLKRYSLEFVKENFSRFFVESPAHGIQDIAYANKEMGLDYKVDTRKLGRLMGWTFTGQLEGYSNKIRSKIISRKNIRAKGDVNFIRFNNSREFRVIPAVFKYNNYPV